MHAIAVLPAVRIAANLTSGILLSAQNAGGQDQVSIAAEARLVTNAHVQNVVQSATKTSRLERENVSLISQCQGCPHNRGAQRQDGGEEKRQSEWLRENLSAVAAERDKLKAELERERDRADSWSAGIVQAARHMCGDPGCFGDNDGYKAWRYLKKRLGLIT